jgi:hypothetical protein
MVAVALLATGCADDGGAGGDGPAGGPLATSAPTEPAECADCRLVAPGNGFQAGDIAVGVTRCDGASCEVVLAEADGTETEVDLAAGDTLDVGDGWVVEGTGADGLLLRPA